ncbi:phenylacetate--CoA ligase family protein [Candidatus Saccharibacteria bacterium]|nr:phenylacetate--CoA ligase family protein [Candidatus Saccharibacteria bacterium]
MVTKRSLALFHKAANEVPAYADFLSSRGFDPSVIKTSHDFKKVPITSKKNYLQQYPLDRLVWQGNLETPLLMCSTSGSTGVPYYFPRNDRLSWQYSWLIEDYLKQGTKKDHQPTLVIIAFGMGVWIAGVITLRAFEIAINRMHYPASLLPVGYNKAEAIKALSQLAPQFKQTIIVGYPPFVKEIIDEAGQRQIDLAKLNVRLLFAAESFTESFRDYVCKKTGADPVLDTLNIYGTADIGAMAYETPLSILIRRLASKDPGLFKAIFGQIEKTPTLAQFNPRFVEFEAVEGEVLLSGDSALPLIRYSVGDNGGVISYWAMHKILSKHGINLDKKMAEAGIKNISRRHPFVFVYERSNFAVSLHGIVIYPEFIKTALIDPELSAYLTGKFTMLTKFDKRHNQYLEINVEQQKNVSLTPRLRALTKKIIRQKLVEKSSEFAEVSKSPGSRKLIKIAFWPYEHPRYFTLGVKQKWVVHDK